MAEDFRGADPNPRALTARQIEIIKECKRQEESCLYTSTTMYLWLRRIRFWRRFFVVTPIFLGGLAGLTFLKGVVPDWTFALCAFLAGLVPSLADALKIETSVDEVSRLAAEYKALQDRFRRNASLTVARDEEKGEEVLSELMDRMDVARSSSLTPPEHFFEKAREKIKLGHYDFSVDGRTYGDVHNS